MADPVKQHICVFQRKKGNKDPSPMVQLSVQNTTKESRICYLTSDPVWEDAFTFYIQDPRKQELDIHVKDDDRALSLGSLSIPLTRLLASPDLSMDQWFQLDNSGRIYINAVLRVLHLNEDASLTSSVSPHLPSPGAGHGDGGTTSEVAIGGVGRAPKPEPTRPQQTTPDSDFASEVSPLTDTHTAPLSLLLSLFAPLSHCSSLSLCSLSLCSLSLSLSRSLCSLSLCSLSLSALFLSLLSLCSLLALCSLL
ncbi:unnamed protein product, partial [Oncorhynchus mykiss]